MHHLKKKIVSDKGMTACRGQRMQAACTGYTYPGGEPTCGCQVHEAGIIAALGHQRERMHAALPICMRWRAGRWLWCWIGRVLGGAAAHVQPRRLQGPLFRAWSSNYTCTTKHILRVAAEVLLTWAANSSASRCLPQIHVSTLRGFKQPIAHALSQCRMSPVQPR